ncbi:hypothetical protein [Pilimelia columellifera]|uniref:Uncharacterized protein n=1 Tax=Pilimelia columellifera subsp. columellifera TaxID=706583 RepID=A0ABP6AZ46_9ACTN
MTVLVEGIVVVKVLLGSLTEAEQGLVRETDRDSLVALDEDRLVELHTRVRRARDKHVKVYRRRAATRVGEVGGRGKARPKNTRDAGKAEIFEDALARVSRRLAMAAQASARALKAERLAEATAARDTAPPATSRRSVAPAGRPVAAAGRPPRPADAPQRRKQHAATRAAGARRQARRDSR